MKQLKVQEKLIFSSHIQYRYTYTFRDECHKYLARVILETEMLKVMNEV